MVSVRLEHVGRRFGEAVAVADLSLEIAAGTFVTLLGPSGCGKTTTLRMVAGLERPTAGRITIGDMLVSDAERGLFVPPERRQLGMVFQSYAIWPHMTVFENVAYPLRIRRRPRAEVEQRVVQALALVEMERFADRPAPALSGGQQQRVAIARSLVFEPALLLLDEPLSNLDARLRVQMGDELRQLQQRLGITSLYVTHDQEEAMALSDLVLVMSGGRVLQQGAPEDIYRRPADRQTAAFFGDPNLLPATVVACRPERDLFAVTLRGEGWAGEGRAGRAFSPGEAAVLVARPEDFTLTASPTNGSPVWEGEVTHMIYRGARRSLTLSTAAGPLRIDQPASRPIATGDRLAAALEPDHGWAVAA